MPRFVRGLVRQFATVVSAGPDYRAARLRDGGGSFRKRTDLRDPARELWFEFDRVTAVGGLLSKTRQQEKFRRPILALGSFVGASLSPHWGFVIFQLSTHGLRPFDFAQGKLWAAFYRRLGGLERSSHPHSFTRLGPPLLHGRASLLGLVAGAGGGLRIQDLRPWLAVGGIQQSWRGEIEKFTHVARCVLPVGVARGERFHVELFLDESQDRGVVPRCVRDEIWLSVR